MEYEEIDEFNEKYVKNYLKVLISNLDDLDEDDFFGTEGWRHTLMGED